MVDLLGNDTDLEMDKYDEASNIIEAGTDLSIEKNKKSVFNPETGMNEILLPMTSGGYVKIKDEAPTVMAQAPQQPTMPEATDAAPVQAVVEEAKRLQKNQGSYTLDDLRAAGYTDEQISTAGLGTTPIMPERRTEPLSEQEVTEIISSGQPIITADPTLRDEGSRVVSTYFFDLAVEGLREELREQGMGSAEIDRTIKARENELLRNAEVYSNALFGTGATGFEVGVGDFATAGVMDIQEGYRMFNQQRGEGGTVGGRAIGMAIMAAGVAEATGVGYAFGKLLKRGAKALEPTLVRMGADAEQRIAQEGVRLYSNPIEPGVDRLLAAMGKLVSPKPEATFYLQAREPGGVSDTAVNRVLEISKANGSKKPTVADLVQFFEENHQQIYGRKLDPNVEEDFDLAVDAAANEVLYQLNQAVSGRGWYDEDVKKTFETLSEVPGLERLADDETLRVIWSAFAAPTSIGNAVPLNTKAATAAFLQYLRTGQVPVNPPAKGAVTEGIPGAGWGMKQKSVAAGMKVISYLIETKGPEGFADWWLSPHTLKELTEVRKAAGLGSGPSGLSGGQNSIHLGAMVLGVKTGRYSLNINGYEGTTKDIWFSRSYNRHFGDMRNPDGSIAGGPRNQTERRRMEEFTARLVDKLKDEGLSEQDAQAVLWFYEQNLFTDLGVVSRPGSFSETAEKISNDLRSGVRGSDEIETGAEQAGEGLTGFRGISAPKRTIRSGRRGGEADVQAFGPYTRGSGEGTEGDGLLSLAPDEQTQRIYSEAGIALPNIQEAPTTTAAQYNADSDKRMSGHTYGAQVEIKSAEELASARLFRTENGSGFAIKPDGDIVAVFQSGNETGSVGYAMIQAAVQAGGRKLDAFDTFLPGIYETAGFRPVARLPWNDEFAPDNWNKETFKNFNNGEPDVVFFVYDPNYFGGATDVPKFTDYDDAVAAQDAEIARLKETIDGY